MLHISFKEFLTTQSLMLIKHRKNCKMISVLKCHSVLKKRRAKVSHRAKVSPVLF